MRPFAYYRPETLDAALMLFGGEAEPPPSAATQVIAGGTNMLDYMKLGVMQPAHLVDINQLQDADLRTIEASATGLRLGALVRMGEAEDHPAIRRDYPLMAEALQLAASPQIRNMATLGGNILQRTRCEYFRETSWACNKRNPGSGCDAMDGFNRQHAVLGTSDKCIATYHGDFAQALIALDAAVDITGSSGNRTIPIAQLHRPPGDTPNIETVLRPGDIITAINVPPGPWTRRSHYLKVRDR
ncbi:MAG TPA: FAD binding domain-containing protein, partial [Acetobacteraceae bacterium]|nr:FAD binding domain-containing protein [Acetobacteraceae bacterium]